MSELKPCPFDGERPEIITYDGKFGWLECPKCSIKIDWVDTKAEAIRLWNTRASDYPPPRPMSEAPHKGQLLARRSGSRRWQEIEFVGGDYPWWAPDDNKHYSSIAFDVWLPLRGK